MPAIFAYVYDHSKKATEQHFPVGLFITQYAQGCDYTFQPVDEILDNSKKTYWAVISVVFLGFEFV